MSYDSFSREALLLKLESLANEAYLKPTGAQKEQWDQLVNCLLDMGEPTDDEWLRIVHAYGMFPITQRDHMHSRVWYRISQYGDACLEFVRTIKTFHHKDVQHLRSAYQFAGYGKGMGSSVSSAADAYSKDIWQRLPEGKLDLALTAAAGRRWSEVLPLLFETSKVSLTSLPPFLTEAERQEAIRLVVQTLAETRNSAVLPEFLVAIEVFAPVSEEDALRYAGVIDSSTDRERTGKLLQQWAARFQTNPNLALANANNLFASNHSLKAEQEFRRALNLGADERVCRNRIAEALDQQLKPNEALAELAILHDRIGWHASDRQLYTRILESALPASLHTGRAQEIGFLKSVGHGISDGVSAIGGWIGGLFGGKDPYIPYRKDLLNTAPRLLRADQMHSALQQSSGADSLQKYQNSPSWASDAAAAGLVLSVDGLFWMGSIDSRVLDAVVFSSAGQDGSWAAIQENTAWFEQMKGDEFAGAFHRLAGYVAEQQVALDLQQSGYEVVFPEASNQEGWDLLVDGQPFQVKLSLDPDLVREHLVEHPDIPVFVNRELAEAFEGNENVFVDPNLSYAEIHETTNETLDAIDGEGLFDFKLPLLTIGLSLFRHGGALFDDKIDLPKFGERVLVDTVYRGGGGFLGAKAGMLLGSPFGPPGMFIGTVLGGVVGAVGGGRVADKKNWPRMCTERDRSLQQLTEFAEWFVNGPLTGRCKALKEKQEAIHAWALRARQTEFPADVISMYEGIQLESLRRAEGVRDWMRSRLKEGDRGKAHAGWHALNEGPSILHPEMAKRIQRVHEALTAYKAAADAKA